MKIINKDEKVIEMSAEKALIPEGEYPARIIDVDVSPESINRNNSKGKIQILWNIEVGTTVQEKKEFFPFSDYEESRWMKFLNALYDGELPEEVHVGDWIGHSALIQIEHQEGKDKKIYDNIVAWDFDVPDFGDDEIEFDEGGEDE